MIRVISFVSVLALFVSLASAQPVVLPPVMAHPPNPTGTGYCETAIVLSGNDVVVAYNDAVQYYVRHSLSVDGGATFNPLYSGVQFIGQDCVFGAVTRGVDPMAARAANGDIVIGGQMALTNVPSKTMYSIARKGLGLSLFGTSVPLTCVESTRSPEKELLAIGPSRDGTRDKLYVSYRLIVDDPCESSRIQVVQADLATPTLTTDLPVSPAATCVGIRDGLGGD
ncbi:MAG: hypothetical protein ACKVW3_06730 [Phycisphaerales bacterium]